VVALSTILLCLVSLIAAAAFAVVARRRLRQLGLFAAIGASSDQVRRVLVLNGAATGAVAALAGTAAGVATWVVAAPGLGMSSASGSTARLRPGRCWG
jgi:putative ABC transport system permease protein